MKVLIVLAALVLGGAAHAGESIKVMNTKAAASMGMAKAGAGYMMVMNHGTEAVRLVGVEADFPRVELHDVVDVDGVMKMVHQENGVVIPAGGELAFRPGSYHVMFMGLPKPFEAGETFAAVLLFEGGQEIPVTFAVVDRKELMQGQMEHGSN